jgi:uncharacterized protein (UPF0147 family)
MALPDVPSDLSSACVALRDAIQPTIALPGGVTLQAISGTDTGDPTAIVKGLMQAANPALAPFMPVFDLIAALQAVKKIAESIAPPNPVAIAEGVQTLTEKLSSLAQFVPQLAVPLMVKTTLDTIIAALEALQSKLAVFAAHNERIAQSMARAETLPEPARSALLAVVSCAANNAATQLANENAALGPINRLIELLNTLLSMIGLPCIPIVGGAGATPEAIALLGDVIAVLKLIQIPTPGFSGPPALPPPGEC